MNTLYKGLFLLEDKVKAWIWEKHLSTQTSDVRIVSSLDKG